MIKYYGTPITPNKVLKDYMTGRNTLVSFAHPQDIDDCLSISPKVIIDNGAFSFWTKKKPVCWDEFYNFLDFYPEREFYFIPDVIDGSEKENDFLLSEAPYDDGVPIWHIAESFERLERLASDYDFIAFGSSGEYSTLGTKEWHSRMNDAMKIVCDEDGIPKVKIHMLRCLDPLIFTKYPFYSGDSTGFARNHSRDGAINILNRIEKYNSPKKYTFKKYYKTENLLDFMGVA